MTGIISTPTMRWDGTLLDKPGYDGKTGLLLLDPPELPEMPDEPTRDDALDALALLKKELRRVSLRRGWQLGGRSVRADYACWRAARRRPYARDHGAASRKRQKLSFDVSSAIALGQLCPVIAAGKTEDEMEKRLGAALMAGQPIISIDNVNGEIGGELLCQAVERPMITPRILGKSEMGQIQNRATFFATGNNIVILDDMTRRTLVCSLDSGEEKPELRRFSTRPAQVVLADRGPYVAACLDHRPSLSPCRSARSSAAARVFRTMVGYGALGAGLAGEDDPVVTMEKARENDPARVTFSGLIHAWAKEIGVGRDFEITAANLIKTAGEVAQGIWRAPQLREALYEIVPERNYNSKTLGRWLARNENKVSGGLKLRKRGDEKSGHRWYLEQL